MQETSVYRHAKYDGTIAGDSLLMTLPKAVAGFFHYHASVLEFHASLTTSNGHDHPWDSKPLSWLLALRPILYSSVTDMQCLGGQSCRQMIYLFGTPIIWWLIIPVLLWSLWQLFFARDRRYLVPVVGFAAGFLPWLLNYDRQMYFFYAVPLIPFIIVGLALFLGHFRRRVVVAYLAAVLGMFIYFSPILYGYPVPDSYYHSIMWLPSWT